MKWMDDGKCFSPMRRIDSSILKWYASGGNAKSMCKIKRVPMACVAKAGDVHV